MCIVAAALVGQTLVIASPDLECNDYFTAHMCVLLSDVVGQTNPEHMCVLICQTIATLDT